MIGGNNAFLRSTPAYYTVSGSNVTAVAPCT